MIDERWVQLYANLVWNGVRTIKQVPEAYREAVKKLNEEKRPQDGASFS